MVVRARVLALVGAGVVVLTVGVTALWIVAEPRSTVVAPRTTPSAAAGPSSSPTSTKTKKPKPTHTFTGTAKVAFLGDSFVAGYGGGGGSYVDQVGSILDATITADGVVGSGLVNYGDGQPYAPRLAALLYSNPDVLVVQGSVNDLQTASQAVANAATALIDTAKKHRPKVAIALVGPIYLTSETLPALLEQRSALETVAAEEKVTYIDPTGWITDATAPTLIGPDRIHPTAAGYTVIATQMAKQLRPVINKLP
jgi:lysophospholipase L1-like esterase